MVARTATATALLAALLLASATHLTQAACSSFGSAFLYVWAGSADASLAKDSLFTFRMCDAPSTPNQFGKLWDVAPTPYNGIEPHHCAISADGRVLGAGGLLAALGGLPSVYFFDLSNANKPKLIHNITQPSQSAIADAFLPTPDNGFLVTMMGSNTGSSPGRVAQYSSRLRLTQEAPGDNNFLGNTGFNPHGIAVNWATHTMVTSDFIDPASTLVSSPGLIARTTVRVWDTRTLRQTYLLDTAADTGIPGHMDATAIGTTGLFYSTRLNGFLYLVDTTVTPPTIRKVYDLGDALNSLPGAGGGLVKSFRNGTRLAISSFSQSKAMLFDTTNPGSPVLLNEIMFPAGAGGHLLTLSTNERLMAVSTYFLDEGAAGIVRAPGDCTVRLVVLNAQATSMAPHPTVPVLDFKNVRLPNGVKAAFRPHGMAFSHK